MNQLKTREGTTILGAAVIDDVVVIIALAFLMSFAGGDVNLSMVILKKVLFFAGAIFVGWKVVPWFLNKFAKLKVTETVISSALIICFVFAYMAEFTGVAAIIGAYIAGVAISVTGFKHEISKRWKQSVIYFCSSLFHFDWDYGSVWWDCTKLGTDRESLVLLAILTKLVGAAFGAKFAGFGWRSSLGIGSAMVSEVKWH